MTEEHLLAELAVLRAACERAGKHDLVGVLYEASRDVACLKEGLGR